MTEDKPTATNEEFDMQVFVDNCPEYTELAPEAINSETQLVIDWGRKRVGFGMLSFFERDGRFYCDNEAMGRDFCKGVLEALIAGLPANVETPPLIARFQTLDALLDASRPIQGEW